MQEIEAHGRKSNPKKRLSRRNREDAKTTKMTEEEINIGFLFVQLRELRVFVVTSTQGRAGINAYWQGSHDSRMGLFIETAFAAAMADP